MESAREHQIGRYELLIELGHGGMAELLLARLHATGGFAKLVAIKRILPHLARDPQFREMFLDEGRIAAHLSHPNICQVFELDDEGGELFLVMEYLDGVSWDHLLAAVAKTLAGPPQAIVAGVLAQAADGLHYAHTLRDATGAATPVVHRDVSPQNLFVTVDGACKVLDFGVSKMMTDGPRTKSGVVKGKLPYMAPEQIRGEDVDARTDVFSLGVCLWEALCAERLYDRSTDFQIWKAITEQDAPDVRTRWTACPPALAEVTRKALAREPAERFASARAFADALRAAATHVASPPALADAVRTTCADRLAARHRAVAAAITERKRLPKAALADGRRSSEDVREVLSAAETLDGGRSAALTLDDKPRLIDDITDAGTTTNLRSGSRKTGDIQLREQSIVVRRSDPAVDPQAVAAARHSRIGLAIGAIAALLVIGVVIVIATRGSSPIAQPAPDAATAPAARPVADAAALAPPADAIAAAVDATIAPAVDAAIAHADAGVRVAPRPALVPAPAPGPASPGPAVPAGTGSLSVTSDPYATIYIDGHRVDDTPLFRRALAAGKHTLSAVRADGQQQTLSIDVQPGKELNLGKLRW